MKRKLMRIGLLLCTCLMMLTAQAFAAQKPIGQIYLVRRVHNKIYISPNGEGKVWAMLKYGQTRKVYGIGQGTYQVKYKGKIGYVRWDKAENVKVIDVVDTVYSGENLYAKPSTKSKVLKKIPSDGMAKVLAYSGRFHKVEIDGTAGWIPVDEMRYQKRTPKPEFNNITVDGINEIVNNYLLSKIGPNYKSGAAGPNKFDSAGLVYHYWHFIKGQKSFPRSMNAQYKFLKTTVPMSELDNPFYGVAAVFFDTNLDGKPDYEGLYMGDGKVLAATKQKGVRLIDLNSAYYRKHFLCAKTFYRGVE